MAEEKIYLTFLSILLIAIQFAEMVGPWNYSFQTNYIRIDSTDLKFELSDKIDLLNLFSIWLKKNQQLSIAIQQFKRIKQQYNWLSRRNFALFSFAFFTA